MSRTRKLGVLCALGLLAACAAPQQAERTPVPEGINKSFLDENLEVEPWVARWELESREVYAARREIIEALGLNEGEAVVDVGTGTGLFVEPMAQEVGRNGTVHALDIAPAFVEHVARRSERQGLPQVQAAVSHERSIGLPAGSADVVFLCDAYHHFEYHEDMLRSMRKALRPGGRLVLIDFERIPGTTRGWLLNHVRAGRDVVRAEVEAAGFRLVDEPEIEGFVENYCLRFERI